MKNKGEVRINLYLNYYDAAVLDAILRLIQHEKANYGESKMPLFFLNSSKDFTRVYHLAQFNQGQALLLKQSLIFLFAS